MSETQTEFHMLIEGELVGTSDRIDVFNPATGAVFATAPAADAALLDRAVAAAQRAFPAWRATPITERKRAILAAADTIEAHAEELAELFTLENGRPLIGSQREFMRAVSWMRGMTEWDIPVDITEEDDVRRVEVHHVPLGVVAGLVPWNFPVVLAMFKLAPPLIAGNTLVLKPSPFTPLCTLRIAELLKDHFPAGVLNIISGTDALGPMITAHPGFAKISFTGSTETGKKIAATAASDLKRLTLELGGNDAAIVLEDADVDAVAPKIFLGAFGNTGQVCVATKRLYVHDTIYDRFRDKMHHLLQTAKVGNGLGDGVMFGPLQNKRQYDRIVELLDDARDTGVTLLQGNDVPENGYFVRLTLVDNPSEDSRTVQEEAFGPILPMMRFSDIDEVIERANATSYGLGGSVWSADTEKATAIAHRLESGSIWVNDNTALSHLTPIGGAKQSGLGVESAQVGLLEYTQPKAIWIAKS